MQSWCREVTESGLVLMCVCSPDRERKVFSDQYSIERRSRLCQRGKSLVGSFANRMGKTLYLEVGLLRVASSVADMGHFAHRVLLVT